MELRLNQETLDFLINIELPDLIDNCDLDEIVLDDICVLLHMMHKLREEKTLAGLLIRGPLY